MREADLLSELEWRGMLHQSTEGIAAALARGTTSGYAGFDPTAPSLHVGSLVPIMGLVQLQQHGHVPVALVGGGTGMIGDPSGKAAERVLQTRDQVAANVAGIRAQLERFLHFSGPAAALLRDNSDWLSDLGAIQFMRDVGKHFTVNYMTAKDSVRSRMDAGISYTEFSYMLLQAYDFLELFRRDGVTLQIGGSDQWGNMTAGVELIRRSTGGEAHAITFPLLATASGAKFGKTEAGSVWLDADRTSPYQFYQFWMNAEDADVGRYLKLFTLLGRDEIEALENATLHEPQLRAGQLALARDVTERVHGVEAARVAAHVSTILFGNANRLGGGAPELTAPVLAALAREVPSADIVLGDSASGGNTAERLPGVVDLFVRAGLASSRGEARRLADQGGAYVNGVRVAASTSADDLTPLDGGYLLLRKGARSYAVVRLLP